MEDEFSPPGDGISDLLLLVKVHSVFVAGKDVCKDAGKDVFRAVVISFTVTSGIIDELFSFEPPNVEEDKFNAILTETEFECLPVNAEVSAAVEGVRAEFFALKLIKADPFSDVTVLDALLDLLDAKSSSSLCVLSWNLCVDMPVNIGSVCDKCGMLVGVL